MNEDDYLVYVQEIIAQRFCFVKVFVVKGGTFTDVINEKAEFAYYDHMTYVCAHKQRYTIYYTELDICRD